MDYILGCISDQTRGRSTVRRYLMPVAGGLFLVLCIAIAVYLILLAVLLLFAVCTFMLIMLNEGYADLFSRLMNYTPLVLLLHYCGSVLRTLTRLPSLHDLYRSCNLPKTPAHLILNAVLPISVPFVLYICSQNQPTSINHTPGP